MSLNVLFIVFFLYQNLVFYNDQMKLLLTIRLKSSEMWTVIFMQLSNNSSSVTPLLMESRTLLAILLFQLYSLTYYYTNARIYRYVCILHSNSNTTPQTRWWRQWSDDIVHVGRNETQNINVLGISDVRTKKKN